MRQACPKFWVLLQYIIDRLLPLLPEITVAREFSYQSIYSVCKSVWWNNDNVSFLYIVVTWIEFYPFFVFRGFHGLQLSIAEVKVVTIISGHQEYSGIKGVAMMSLYYGGDQEGGYIRSTMANLQNRHRMQSNTGQLYFFWRLGRRSK